MAFSCEILQKQEITSAQVKTRQRTLQKSVSISGAGLFSGEIATVRLHPAAVDSGVVFSRLDLPSSVKIPATYKYLINSSRCTTLGVENVSIQTVEHLLAALFACNVNNVLVEISGPEVPILDGSAAPFVEMIERAGLSEQEAQRPLYQIKTPLFWSKGDVHLIALPSEEYRISYTLHYPHSAIVGSQYYSVVVDEPSFKQEIALSRTFSLYEEIKPMIEKGFIKGGSLENGIVVGSEGILNPEGLRLPQEMVRHKILDLIGDLSLTGIRFLGHIIAIRSGHASNCAFGIELLKDLYRNNPKNRNFDKEAPQNACPERAAIAEGQDASEGKGFEVKPTPSKTDSSGCFGIYTWENS